MNKTQIRNLKPGCCIFSLLWWQVDKVRVMHTKSADFSILITLISLTFCLSTVGASAESHSDNKAFNAAVEAVKARDYSRALILFEQQANDAEHDAQ